MLPVATISHQTSGRIRLRISAKRRDAAYFSALQEELRHCPGVLGVESNPLTGSVLIHHRSAPRALIDYAQERQLFSTRPWEDAKSPPSRFSDRLSGRFAKLNQTLGDHTRGEIGLSDVAVLSLIGLSLFQMLVKKKILPAGVTLLWYATSLHLLLAQQTTAKKKRVTSTDK